MGPIHTIDYLHSGSLILTTKTFNQVSLLLDTSHLPTSKIPITSTVAWNQQFTYGKLYDREFSFDSLETTLEYLRPHNVVAIRRLHDFSLVIGGKIHSEYLGFSLLVANYSMNIPFFLHWRPGCRHMPYVH